MHGAANSRSDVGTSWLRLADRPRRGGERWTLKRPIRILPPHSRQRNTQRRRGKKEADRTRGTTAEVLKVEEEVVGKKIVEFLSL